MDADLIMGNINNSFFILPCCWIQMHRASPTSNWSCGEQINQDEVNLHNWVLCCAN